MKRPYDLVVVVTDVPLTTREERSVEGLASRLARVVVVSTRRLLRTHDGEAVRALDSPAIRWNAATLLVHLFGYVFYADHNDGGVMTPFSFDPSRWSVPPFDADKTDYLRGIATGIPEADVSRGRLRRLAFHAVSLFHLGIHDWPGLLEVKAGHDHRNQLPLPSIEDLWDCPFEICVLRHRLTR